jgi:hypothetical protein
VSPVWARRWDGGEWRGRGGTVGPVTRSHLPALYGTYVPGLTPNTVGLMSEPTEQTAITNATATIPSSTTLIENTRFRSNISFQQSTTPIVLRNCHIVGNNPQDVYASRQTADPDIPGYGLVNFSARRVILEDCTVDHGWWNDVGLSNRISYNGSFGIWGGNVELIRTEIRRFTDSINFAGRPNGANAQTKVIASRLYNNYFATSTQIGGITHSDNFQVNTGHSIEIAYSYLGGDYTHETGTTATALGFVTPGANNAVILLQQEPDSGPTERADPNWYVRDINIHDNWLHGSAATVNLNCVIPGHFLFNPLEGTATSGVRIIGNRFAVRGGANESGFQIVKTTSIASYLADNVGWVPGGNVYGNGVLLTAANGGIVTEADEVPTN